MLQSPSLWGGSCTPLICQEQKPCGFHPPLSSPYPTFVTCRSLHTISRICPSLLQLREDSITLAIRGQSPWWWCSPSSSHAPLFRNVSLGWGAWQFLHVVYACAFAGGCLWLMDHRLCVCSHDRHRGRFNDQDYTTQHQELLFKAASGRHSLMWPYISSLNISTYGKIPF